MKRLLCLLLLVWAAGRPAGAAELVGDITLKSGKVLHHAKVLNDQYDSIVVFASEGMVKVKKSDLPAALAEKYPERPAPPPVTPMATKPLTVAGPDEARRPRPAPPVPVPVQEDPTMFHGCLITNYALKPLQATLGCVEVTIHNNNENPVEIVPAAIRCITNDGKAHAGNRFFTITDDGQMTMKKKETIPPSGDVKDVVYFQSEALDIQSVVWAK